MTKVKTTLGRRSFIKSTALAGGGMMIGFSWFASCKPSKKEILELPKEWYNFNGYLKIGENGVVTISSPNPEIGQNVKTSMPMIVAEELDIDWDNVIVEQADLNTSLYSWQIAGGSRSISSSWDALRMAGATAKHMLKEVAAKNWNVSASELTTENGIITHKASGKTIGYGEVASAASELNVPKEVKLKEPKDYKIIGTSRKNVDSQKIVTGQALYGIDYNEKGALIAMIVHPPAFGMKLKSVDLNAVKSMPGIKDAFVFESYKKETERQWSDVQSFTELIAVVGDTTWQVMNAKKTIQPIWETERDNELENSENHLESIKNIAAKNIKVVRKDGDPASMFKKAAFVLERKYSCPFLAHSTLEPMNFFANVTADKAILTGPIQTPEFMEKTAAARLGIPIEKIEVKLTRMGGGFGRRLYGHFGIEAAVISQMMKQPIKLIYTREDDMTTGIYRPAYHATYKAAFDENKNLTAFHVIAGGIPESPLEANRFPAGAIDHYMAEEWAVPSNISVGAFRAPRSNFIAGAEQSFLDEIAEYVGKDPIQFRLDLFEKAKTKPIGKDNDYDAERYAGVLKLVKEKAAWDKPIVGVSRGVSAYFCHDTYVAHVLDVVMEKDKPIIKKVTSVVDCGIVINPDAATNLSQGAVVDGIGHAMYSSITFKDGTPEQSNFNKYRLIRQSEAPTEIEVHFVKNEKNPTGMGEPSGPPVIGALANALYKATGKRVYDQPFFGEKKVVG
jgi:isoquinoline 1-oxidoreductase subunit beta